MRAVEVEQSHRGRSVRGDGGGLVDGGDRLEEEVVPAEAGVAFAAVRVEDPERRPPPRRAISIARDQRLRPLADDVAPEADPRPPREFEAEAARLGDRGREAAGEPGRIEDDEEQFAMTVYYAVAGVYLHGGTATFTNTLEILNSKPVYHIVGEGHTNSSYDLIFKVRDRYETYIDTSTMQPLKFIRNVNEGGYKKIPECYVQ